MTVNVRYRKMPSYTSYSGGVLQTFEEVVDIEEESGFLKLFMAVPSIKMWDHKKLKMAAISLDTIEIYGVTDIDGEYELEYTN